jgi:hypothetical protein
MRSCFILICLACLTTTALGDDFAIQNRIRETNETLARAKEYVPKPIDAADPADYFYALSYSYVTPMQRTLDSAKSGVHHSLEAGGAAYRTMMANLKEVEALCTRATTLLAPGALFDAVIAKHRRHEGADAEIAKLDAAIAAAAAATAKDPWAASHVAAFRRMAAKLRADNAPIAAAHGEKKQRDASAAAQRALVTKLAELRDLAEKQMKLSLAGEPVPAEAIAALTKAIDDADRQSPDAGLFTRRDLLALRILQAWERPDAEAADALATLLSGRVEQSGRTNGKRLGVTIAAKADRCYVLLGRFAAQGDVAKVDTFDWQLAKGHQVQQWTVPALGVGLLRGFCAHRDEKVVATGELAFQGTKNGVRWTVISFARTAFPDDLAIGLTVERGDHCDPAYWEAIWTRPIPQTIGYDGSEPVLVLAPGSVMPSDVIRLNDPTKHGANEKALTSAPSGSVRFTPAELYWGYGCPVNDKDWNPPRSTASLAIAQCVKRVDGKHAGTWSKIAGQRAAARAAGGIAPAVEDRATALSAREGKEYAACHALHDQVEKKLRKVNEALVDRFLDKPLADPSKRVERWFRATKLRSY